MYTLLAFLSEKIEERGRKSSQRLPYGNKVCVNCSVQSVVCTSKYTDTDICLSESQILLYVICFNILQENG